MQTELSIPPERIERHDSLGSRFAVLKQVRGEHRRHYSDGPSITLLTVLISTCFLVVQATAATIRVPQDYETIQEAVNAARLRDEVVVSPGIYIQENTLITGAVTLRSTFDGTDWSIVENTVIKAAGLGTLIAAGSGAVIRGFTITRDPITVVPGVNYVGRGINSSGADATIEFNIIENHVNITPSPPYQFPGIGAAVLGINGPIRNNIIRNNRAQSSAALYQCDGPITNNVIYSNSSGMSACNDRFINNTMYNSGGIGSALGLTIANCILWDTEEVSFVYGAPPPANSIIKGYTGPGTSIITDDPQFVDPANGDFRLMPTSPAIDAGAVVTEVTADFFGVQRGLKANPALPGAGPFYDIGAHEFIPSPLAVWLPFGGPAEIRSGDRLDIAWQMEPGAAGTEIRLFLFDEPDVIADFGAFGSVTGEGVGQVALPLGLATKSSYTIQGVSILNGTLMNSTPPMTILFVPNAVRAEWWTRY